MGSPGCRRGTTRICNTAFREGQEKASLICKTQGGEETTLPRAAHQGKRDAADGHEGRGDAIN